MAHHRKDLTGMDVDIHSAKRFSWPEREPKIMTGQYRRRGFVQV